MRVNSHLQLVLHQGGGRRQDVSLDRAAEYIHKGHQASKVLPRIGVHAHQLRAVCKGIAAALGRDACAWQSWLTCLGGRLPRLPLPALLQFQHLFKDAIAVLQAGIFAAQRIHF